MVRAGPQPEHRGPPETLRPCEVVNVNTLEVPSQPARGRVTAVSSSRVIVLAIIVLLVVTREGRAQQADSHVDAGGHYSALVLGDPGQARSGVGGWFRYQFVRGIALDA